MKIKFTKEQTTVAKGIAISLMLVHHLYSVFPNRIIPFYYSMLPFRFPGLDGSASYTIEFIFGAFAKICVAIFLFLSGYGMYKSLEAKKRNPIKYALIKIGEFFRTYWICFAVFVPIGLIFFSNLPRYVFSWKSLITGLFGFSNSFNGEWWFVELYILLMIAFPAFDYISEKFGSLVLFVSSGILLSLSKWFMFGQEFLFWQFVFVTGYLFAKEDLFEKSDNLFSKELSFVKALGIIVSIFLVKLLVFNNSFRTDIFFAPFFAYYSVLLVKGKWMAQLTVLIGKHSLQIWLIHTFFAYYYFHDIVFSAKFSLLIFIWLMLLSLISAIVLAQLEKLIIGMFRIRKTIG